MAEKRLIDANALACEVLAVKCNLVNGKSEWLNGYRDALQAVLELITEAPTVDAVEVVRCKDCKWRNTKGCPYKNFNAVERSDDDFCSDGERRTDGR